MATPGNEESADVIDSRGGMEVLTLGALVIFTEVATSATTWARDGVELAAAKEMGTAARPRTVADTAMRHVAAFKSPPSWP